MQASQTLCWTNVAVVEEPQAVWCLLQTYATEDRKAGSTTGRGLGCGWGGAWAVCRNAACRAMPAPFHVTTRSAQAHLNEARILTNSALFLWARDASSLWQAMFCLHHLPYHQTRLAEARSGPVQAAKPELYKDVAHQTKVKKMQL